jgi:hypothetical protein
LSPRLSSPPGPASSVSGACTAGGTCSSPAVDGLCPPICCGPNLGLRRAPFDQTCPSFLDSLSILCLAQRLKYPCSPDCQRLSELLPRFLLLLSELQPLGGLHDLRRGPVLAESDSSPPQFWRPPSIRSDKSPPNWLSLLRVAPSSSLPRRPPAFFCWLTFAVYAWVAWLQRKIQVDHLIAFLL